MSLLSATIAFPLDVVKTNRILNTSFNKECGENLGRELMTLFERGQFRSGLYRGFIPFLMITGWRENFSQNIDMTLAPMLAAATAALQPFETLIT